MDLWDSHAHLQDPELAPHLEAAMRRAEMAGVRHIVCNGTQEADWPLVAQLAKQAVATHPTVIPCYGLHPWHVKERSGQWLKSLETALTAGPSGVGEIGLDRWIEPRDEAAQETVFRAQLALARRLNRPVMIHCLRAWDWLMRVLREEPPPAAGMLLHAFGGPLDCIKPLANMGAYFSFAGDVLNERKLQKRAALLCIPPERLLLETDAPDLIPPELFRVLALTGVRRKQLNEPANLAEILRGVARLLGESPETLAIRVFENGRRFFKSIQPNQSAGVPA
jgi:TatD DNase family protein